MKKTFSIESLNNLTPSGKRSFMSNVSLTFNIDAKNLKPILASMEKLGFFTDAGISFETKEITNVETKNKTSAKPKAQKAKSIEVDDVDVETDESEVDSLESDDVETDIDDVLSDDSDNETPEISAQDVREAVQKFIKHKKFKGDKKAAEKEIKKTFKKYDATCVSDLDSDSYSDFISDLK